MLSLPDFKHHQILVVFSEDGNKVSVKNSNIIVTNAEGEMIQQSIGFKNLIIFMIGHFSISSGLVELAKRLDFKLFV